MSLDDCRALHEALVEVPHYLCRDARSLPLEDAQPRENHL